MFLFNMMKTQMIIEWITTDSSYSPVIRVNHEVDCIRVGKELDHDLLNISVITNGIVKPDDAMKQAVSLCDHYSIFNSINEQPQSEVDEEKSAEDAMTSECFKYVN